MASLLETFFIMFESNADKVKRGNDEAKKSTDDLEQSLTRTDRQAVQLGDHFLSTIKGVTAGLAGAFAVGSIVSAVRETAEYEDQLNKVANSLGENVSDLDAWGQAAARSGGSVEGFTSSLGSLNRGMADMVAKGRSRLSPFFDELKIKMVDTHGKVRPTLDLMLDLAGAFEKISKQESTGYAEKLGLDQGTMMLLQSGRRSVEGLVSRQRALGTVTKEGAERAEKFNDQWDDTKQIFRGVYIAIGNLVLPVLTEVLKAIERMVDYLSRHKDIVVGFFVAVGTVIASVYLPAIVEAAAATIAAIAPFVLIAAAIVGVAAAFALVYDDVMNFLHGNQSVIGELSKKWPWIGALVKRVATDIAAVFQWAVGVISSEMNLLVAIARFVFEAFEAGARLARDGFAAFSGFIEAKIAALVKAFPLLGTVFRTVGAIFSIVGEQIKAVLEWIFDKIAHAADLIKMFTGWVGKATNFVSHIDAVSAGKGAVATATHASIGAHTTNSLSRHTANKSVTVHVDKVSVETQATDTDGIGKTIGGALEKHLRQAANHFDDGVLA